MGGLGAQRIGETGREKAKKNEQMRSGWAALEHVACMRSWTFNEVVSQAPDQLLVPHGSQYKGAWRRFASSDGRILLHRSLLFKGALAGSMKLSNVGRVKEAKKS